MKRERGITLIALIITIIIMLILVGVTVTVALNGGLFKIAKKSSNDTQIEADREVLYSATIAAMDENLVIPSAQELLNNLPTKWQVEGTDTYKCTSPKGTVLYVVADSGEISEYKFIKNSTNKNDSYVGYFADIEADGLVDGVIFVDLLTLGKKDKQEWKQWGNTITYSLPDTVTISNVKSYYISQESYTDSHFGTHPVISPKSTNGEKRFYIMQLKNFTTDAYTDSENQSNSYPEYNSYYFYKNAKGKMTSSSTSAGFGKGYINTGVIIGIWNTNGETGGYENATQDNRDLWKHIQTQYDAGWFIPSRDEWAAFGNEFGITSSNYSTTYGFGKRTWSSTIRTSEHAYSASFCDGYIGDGRADELFCVRLATTF